MTREEMVEIVAVRLDELDVAGDALAPAVVDAVFAAMDGGEATAALIADEAGKRARETLLHSARVLHVIADPEFQPKGIDPWLVGSTFEGGDDGLDRERVTEIVAALLAEGLVLEVGGALMPAPYEPGETAPMPVAAMEEVAHLLKWVPAGPEVDAGETEGMRAVRLRAALLAAAAGEPARWSV